MTTNKAVSLQALAKPSRKNKKHLIKKVKKSRTKKTKRNNIIKSKTSSISNLYSYESVVTNKSDSLVKSNSNYIHNVNIINGLKDYLAVKK